MTGCNLVSLVYLLCILAMGALGAIIGRQIAVEPFHSWGLMFGLGAGALLLGLWWLFLIALVGTALVPKCAHCGRSDAYERLPDIVEVGGFSYRCACGAIYRLSPWQKRYRRTVFKVNEDGTVEHYMTKRPFRPWRPVNSGSA